MGRISGPLLDRFDLRIDVPSVSYSDLELPADGESSNTIAERVARVRNIQTERFTEQSGINTNADAEGELLHAICELDTQGKALLGKAADQFSLSARSYHRVLRVSRTIADLDGAPSVKSPHIAEAIGYRLSLIHI